MPTSSSTPSVPASACPTRRYLETVPTDLMTWAQVEEELSHTPHPMSARNVRRRFKRAGGVVWEVPGRRGEHVSYTAVLTWHRDFHRGWLAKAA